MATSPGESATGSAPLPIRLQSYSAELWLLAVLSYGVGDTATTVFGITTGRAAEGGPVMSAALAGGGTVGLITMKFVTLAAFYLAWRTITSPGRIGVPLALSFVGIVVTAWNLFVLLQ